MVFFGVDHNKISRLINSQLPLLLGNSPVTLSLVLRIFILTSDPDDADALSRALCLLENPLIGVTMSAMELKLKLFFVF